ncbi:MAG: glutathione S-transferase [Acidobacteria bacterium]|nr:glutathione S-transferase [Acidobacteriota bacterium]
MELFGSLTSPFVRHCRIALMQGSIPWTFVPTDYAASAAKSPTKKVPFLSDGDKTFTDSSSILAYVRAKQGLTFLADAEDWERYASANTVLDAAINLFLLEKDGLGTEVPYLARQSSRVQSGLQYLNERAGSFANDRDDAAIRIACLLDWGRFRNRFGLNNYPHLQGFLIEANTWDLFRETAPPTN